LPDEGGWSIASVFVGSVYLILQNIVSTVVGVLGYSFMARMISQEEMGVVAGITLLHSLVQVLVDFGLNTSIIKFVSESIGRKTSYAKHVFSTIFFRLLTALVTFTIVFSSSTEISRVLFGSSDYSGLLSIVAIDMVFASINALLNGVLLGAGFLKSMAFFNASSIIVRWVSIVLLLGRGYGLTGVFYGWIAGSLVLLILLSFSTFRLRSFGKQSGEFGVLWSMLKFSMPVYVSSLISFLYTWYDKALILIFLPLQQLGVYNVAYTAFSVFTSIATAISSALLSYYGVVYGRGEHDAISEGMRSTSKYTMLLLFPLALGLASTSRHVLILFADRQYESGWLTLATLSVFGLAYGVSSALGNLLLVYGKTKEILVVTLLSTLLSICFMPLVFILNLMGLAIVKGMSILLSLVFSLYFLSKTVRIRFEFPVMLKILFSSIVMAFSVFAVQQVLQGSLFLPLHVIVGIATYVLLIRKMKILTDEDAKLFREIFGENFSKYVIRVVGIKTS